MCNIGGSLTVSNCVFTSNPGGGIAPKGGGLTVTNSTFVGNFGNGLYNFFMPSSLALHNCIVWSNSGGQIVCEEPSTAAVTYSDVQGGWPGEGNMDADPLFANVGAGNLHLLAGSPCIDAGTNSPPRGLPAADIEGNPRPTDGDDDGVAVADMGAYEHQVIVGAPTPVGENVRVGPADSTTVVDTVNQMVSGVVYSLSPFAVLEPSLLHVDIDIKPGSSPNSVNRNGAGLLPVAVLGSANLDVREIDPLSLKLAGLDVRVKSNGTPQCTVEDVNRDSYVDLVCQFAGDTTVWQEGTATAVLTGNLKTQFGAVAIQGADEIRVVP